MRVTENPDALRRSFECPIMRQLASTCPRRHAYPHTRAIRDLSIAESSGRLVWTPRDVRRPSEGQRELHHNLRDRRFLKSSQPALEVARGSSYLIVRNIINTAVSIGAFAVIARLISQAEMGIVAILMLVQAGGVLLAGLGVTTAVTRFVASHEAAGEHEETRRAGYGYLMICVMATSIVVVAVYLSAGALAQFLWGDDSRSLLLRLLTIEIAATSVSGTLTGVLAGLRRFKEISMTSIATFTVRQFLVVIFLTLRLGLPGIVVAWGIGGSLSSAILLLLTRKFLGPVTTGFNLAKLLRFSSPLLLGDAASCAWSWFDRAILIPMVSLAQLGAYNVAVTAFGILDSMPTAISGTLFAYYSHFYGKGEVAGQTLDLENAISRASRYVSFLTIPLAVGLATTAMPATTLLAGNLYAESAYPLAVLSISLAAACLVRALSQIFVVLGKTGTSAFVTCISVAISLLAAVVLVPYFGIVGASLARGLSLALALVISILVLRGVLRLRFDIKAYKCAWIASLFMAAAVLLLEALLYSNYLLPAYVVAGGLVYFLGLRSLRALDQQDIQLMSDFLGSRLRVLSGLLKQFMVSEPAPVS